MTVELRIAGLLVVVRTSSVRPYELAVLFQMPPGWAVERAEALGIVETGSTSQRRFDPVSVAETVSALVDTGELEPLTMPLLVAIVRGGVAGLRSKDVYAGRIPSLDRTLSGLVAVQQNRAEET